MSQLNNMQEQLSRDSWRRAVPLLVLLVAATGLRAAVLVVRRSQLERDPDAYRLIAENLREHGVLSSAPEGAPLAPTAFRPPLYPLLLATLVVDRQVPVYLVAALHLALGVLSVLLAWMLARQWQMRRGSYCVAALVACDPILLNQSVELMTETLATFLVLASLIALTHLSVARSWKAGLLAGMALGFAALCRPTFLVWMALATVAIVFFYRRRGGVRIAATVLGGCLLVLMPWVIRNQLALGRPILLTTHGGYTLLLGNNPFFYRHLRSRAWGSVWDARELLPLLESEAGSDAVTSGSAALSGDGRAQNGGHSEIVRDRYLYDLAYKSIRQNPAMFIYASLVRVARFWTPLPHRLSDDEPPGRTLLRWCVAVWYAAVYLVALFGLWYLGRHLFVPPWVWGLACLIALTAVHTFYWSNMRMRAPVMPVVYLAFVVGAAEVGRKGVSAIGQNVIGCGSAPLSHTE